MASGTSSNLTKQAGWKRHPALMAADVQLLKKSDRRKLLFSACETQPAASGV